MDRQPKAPPPDAGTSPPPGLPWTTAERLRWALWLTVAALLRLRALPPTVADVDGVNFARALRGFDPAHQAPHFPGYGVYVGVTRLAQALGASEVLALALPGLLASLLGAALLALAVRRGLLGRVDRPRRAELALVASALLPGAVLFSAWPTSDGLGFGLGLLALSAAGLARVTEGPLGRARWGYTAAILGGLLLGVRLSWWPTVLVPAAAALARPGTARRAGLLTFATVGLAVLGPLLIVLSPQAALSGLLGFGEGHLTHWGGAASGASDLPSRALRMVSGLATLVGAWRPGAERVTLAVSAGALVVAALAVRRGPSPRALPSVLRVVLLTTIAYFGWLLLAQNVEKPRHLLPALPLVALLAALALAHARAPAWALAGALTLVAGPRALAQARLAPGPALAQHILHNHAPAALQIFAGEEARVFEHLAPAYRVWRPATPEVLRASADRAARAGALVLVTSGTPGVAEIADHLVEVKRVRAPSTVRAHDFELVLYRYTLDPDRTLHANR